MSVASAKAGRPPAVDVAKVLAARYPSYHEPFRLAWSLNRQQDRQALAAALELLAGLKRRYPHVLKVRYELALCLAGLSRRDEAALELEQAGREFPLLDEDTWCLWGRCYKEVGDEALKQGLLSEAERHYRLALEKYQRAFDLDGNRFPGINLATLRLVLASVLAGTAERREWRVEGGASVVPHHASRSTLHAPESGLRADVAGLRREAEETARGLLAESHSWKVVLPDDPVWIRATEAEAGLLLQHWEEAAKLYRSALAGPDVQPFHADSMRKQVERILDAFRRLAVEPGDDFRDLDTLFPRSPSLPQTGGGMTHA